MEKNKKRPDFIAKAVREDGDVTRWTDIGVAFTNPGSETISILLNALPLGDKIVLMKPREEEKEPAKEYNPFKKA